MNRFRNKHNNTLVIRLADESTAAITKFHNDGGGFIHAMPTEAFERDFVLEKMPPKIVRAMIGGDFMEAVFFAYMSERRWNGWAVAYFTEAQAAELAIIIGGDAKFVAVDGVMVFSYLDELEGVRVEHMPCEVDTVDGPRTLYQIGDGWCWSCYNTGVIEYVEGL